MAVTTYWDLDAWKQAMILAEVSYRVTAAMPAVERFGLVQQIRRAAVSIPANVAEGYSRQNDRVLAYYLSIALGELGELETEFELSRRLGFITSDAWRQVSNQATTVGRLLSGFKRRVQVSGVVTRNGARNTS